MVSYNNESVTSDKNVELEKTWSDKDASGLETILAWFVDHNPFEVADGKLRSLSSGVIPGEYDKVICDTVEDIGHCIQASLDGCVVNIAKINR